LVSFPLFVPSSIRLWQHSSRFHFISSAIISRWTLATQHNFRNTLYNWRFGALLALVKGHPGLNGKGWLPKEKVYRVIKVVFQMEQAYRTNSRTVFSICQRRAES
jgi:hypothetical protein